MAIKLHCDNCDKVTTTRHIGMLVTIQPSGYNVKAFEPRAEKLGRNADPVLQVLCVNCMRQLLIEMAAKLPQSE